MCRFVYAWEERQAHTAVEAVDVLGVHEVGAADGAFFEARQIYPAVVVDEEDVLPVVPPLGDVMRRAGYHNSRLSGHRMSLAHRAARGKEGACTINSYCPEWHLLKLNWFYSLRLRFLTPRVVLSRIAKDSSRIS